MSPNKHYIVIRDTDMILKSKVGIMSFCTYIKAAYALLDLEIKE